VKFKSDGCGWRDLVIGDTSGDHLQVSVDVGDNAFIAVTSGRTYAAHDLTRKQLLRLAFNILKELSK
jgi:hypothetical protein